MGKNKRRNYKGYAAHCKFYLINPVHGARIDNTVKKLMGLKSVQEVHVTEGNCGFIVKAKGDTDSELIQNLVREPNRICEAISYVRYKK